MGDIWCLAEISSAAENLPVSRSEKKPLESISAAKERAMELEEIMEEGMLEIPVSCDMESPSLRPVREEAMESCLLRLQSDPCLLEEVHIT